MAKLRNQRAAMATLDTRIARPAPKLADTHYHTAEHQAWRAEVIRRSNGRCQGAGCTTPWRAARLFADHITELRDGGAATDVANGQALCGSCHTRKTAAARAARMARPT